MCPRLPSLLNLRNGNSSRSAKLRPKETEFAVPFVLIRWIVGSLDQKVHSTRRSHFVAPLSNLLAPLNIALAGQALVYPTPQKTWHRL
jgi:hypothetical protein